MTDIGVVELPSPQEKQDIQPLDHTPLKLSELPIITTRRQRMNQIFHPIISNGVVKEVKTGLGMDTDILISISRGMIAKGDEVSPPAFADFFRESKTSNTDQSQQSETKFFPSKKYPANGKVRTVALALAKKIGLLKPSVIITTSGYAIDPSKTEQNALTEEEKKYHYGEVQKKALETRGIDHVPIEIQDKTKDTVGELAILPHEIRKRIEGNEQLKEKQTRVTIYSSSDQVTRMSAIDALIYMRHPEGVTNSGVQEVIKGLEKELTEGPLVQFIKLNKKDIIEMAKEGRVDKSEAAKALYLADKGQELANPDSLKQASEKLFTNPRFTTMFAEIAPNLGEDLKWMTDHGVSTKHLTAEEVFIAAAKEHDKEAEKYLEHWMSPVYGTPARQNEVLPTFLGELAGTVDFLTGKYYAQGKDNEEKEQFVAELINTYFSPAPVKQ